MHLNNEMNPEEENDSEILRKLSPTLFEQKRAIDDAPPEGYFNSFADKMMARIDAEAIPELQKPKNRLINFRNIAIAASIALLLAFLPYFKTIMNSNSDAVAVVQSDSSTPDDSDINDLLASYVDDSDIYAELSDDNITIDLPLPETDSEFIIDYLIDEDVSNQSIIESLNSDDI